MEDDTIYELARRRMVKEQLEGRDIRSERVLQAMRTVPRHLFVPPDYQHRAYADGPLPIGEGQTISQPYIVALMTQMLKLAGTEKVLEVGTGSGYQAAVLGALAREVHTVEYHQDLAEKAAHMLHQFGYKNVEVHIGDGSLGWPPDAPYDAILVTAAAPQVPPPLLSQMAEGGRLVIPVGGPGDQFLELWKRRSAGYTHDAMVPVAFVPLRGKFGWGDEAW
jgi:protein-L-isoaspartate(D-aspartate) O-methyltransferase